MKYSVALLIILSSATTAAADPVLYSGADIPKGYADGFKYSIRSHAVCTGLMKQVPLDAPVRSIIKCIVKTDPHAKPLPPMS